MTYCETVKRITTWLENIKRETKNERRREEKESNNEERE